MAILKYLSEGWWLYSGLTLKYSCSAINDASYNGHINILKLWKECREAGMDFKYTSFAFYGASMNMAVDLLM